ncbi:hypothetical protein EDB85DRAFT_951521 [Lactarius pseudohatsudake]|nr:hypothetical protein EDB85DRAFT_951521 [Lactarius pseudohatsudake]
MLNGRVINSERPGHTILEVPNPLGVLGVLIHVSRTDARTRISFKPPEVNVSSTEKRGNPILAFLRDA